MTMRTALEMMIEDQWNQLCRARTCRTYFLTRTGFLIYVAGGKGSGDALEVGTYTSGVTLADFRADVFWAHEQLHGGRYG